MMSQQKIEVDPKIERWHQDFERVLLNWTNWCERNAAKYDSSAQAWAAFTREYQQLSVKFDLCAA